MGLQSASGGLTKSKLEQATAVPGDVVAPETFYAGDKELKTGTLTEMPAINRAVGVGSDGDDVLFTMENGAYRTNNSAYNRPEIRATKADVIRYGLGLVERGTNQYAGGIGSGGSGSSAYIAFNRIPEGIYRANGTDWGPEIRANLDDVLNTLIHSTVAWNSVKPGDNQNETWEYSIQRGTVWVMVVQGTGQDANTVAGCSISTPNCTTLFDVNVNVTTNPSNATRPLKIRGFRANADTTVSGYTMCGTGHAARYFGLYRIV